MRVVMITSRCSLRLLAAFAIFSSCVLAIRAQAPADDALAWPAVAREQKPWTYWWWMASAVDETNITRELTRYRDAGLGGVHIIPIYGAKGWESNYITYLSPRWMDMLRHTVAEAERLGLGVDMTTGSGWCFGGPRITDEQANASLVSRQIELAAGERLDERFARDRTHALMAFGPDNRKVDLLPLLDDEGRVNWTAEGGPWRVYALSQKPSGQAVKRAGPGGRGHMLNLFYVPAMTNFLSWFDEAFASYSGPKPRAQYHDSYEYRSEWAPDFLRQFEQRRGYRLQEELPAFLARPGDERTARIKCDYRQTLSELMSEVTLPLWVNWSHRNGFITRNEAHGSPGNLLDLYALADIPETEMFHQDRNKLVSKLASSAAHVAGRKFTSSETGTWLKEHFTETLADMKYLLDDLFLSGVNHIFYHGTCYSPDEAEWPGWLFYASYQMNPRNSVWRDVSALNAYAARCQAVLQAGQPDNDLLLYWPIHDRWSSPDGMAQPFTVHAREWLEDQPFGRAAEWLWNRGYQFDYVSDRQIGQARVEQGDIRVPGGRYRAVIVPRCELMPEQTLSNLLSLAQAGAQVIFEDQLPKDVPGLGRLDARRIEFKQLLEKAVTMAEGKLLSSTGRVVIGSLENALGQLQIQRESLVDQAGLLCIRRKVNDGRFYFIANRGTNTIDGWVPLASPAQSALILDPLSGCIGIARIQSAEASSVQVYLQLAPGESIIVRTLQNRVARGTEWAWWKPDGEPVALEGTWQVKFVQGGPELPASFETARLASWTELGDANAQRFAGTASYTLRFDAPGGRAGTCRIDLGTVCQSARVRLNGVDMGTLITPPFAFVATELKPTGNVLEIEVTNVSANRIRDLDRRGVVWRNFEDINFVNINYRPFNAANWPLTDSGLLGPVTVTPLARAQ